MKRKYTNSDLLMK